MKTVICGRCGGRGFIERVAHIEHGICFACHGRGKVSEKSARNRGTPVRASQSSVIAKAVANEAVQAVQPKAPQMPKLKDIIMVMSVRSTDRGYLSCARLIQNGTYRTKDFIAEGTTRTAAMKAAGVQAIHCLRVKSELTIWSIDAGKDALADFDFALFGHKVMYRDLNMCPAKLERVIGDTLIDMSYVTDDWIEKNYSLMN